MAVQPVRKIKKPAGRKPRLRWSRVAMLTLPPLLVLGGIWGMTNLRNPLKLKTKNFMVEYGSPFQPMDNVKSLFMDSVENINTEGDVDDKTVGAYDYSYTYKGKDYPFTVSVKDTQAPAIKLKDCTTDTFETVKPENFIESITDASDFTYKMDNREDTKEPGTFKVVLTAKYQYGNESTASCRLIRKIDRQAPSLEGFEKQLEVLQGETYASDVYHAVDDLDPTASVSCDTSKLDMNVPGKYKVGYTVRDRSDNEETYVQEVTVKENPDFGKKIVYLTFDDGPSENTGKIRKILDDYNVKATFFVTGNQPAFNKYMKEAADKVHTVGLHTYGHKYDQLYASEQAYFEDLQKISDLVEQETGIKSDVIRFPGGSSNTMSSQYAPGLMTRLVSAVHEACYQFFDWNADSTDASGHNVSADTIIANSTAPIGMDRVNILFHDTDAKDTTVEALPAIIEAYQNAGYIFKPVTKDAFAPHHGVSN